MGIPESTFCGTKKAKSRTLSGAELVVGDHDSKFGKGCGGMSSRHRATERRRGEATCSLHLGPNPL